MNILKAKDLCKIHQSECVAMDINPQIDQQNRYFCQKCLISKIKEGKIISFNEVEDYFSDIKMTFKQRKVAQNKKNLEILKELASNVISLKNFYNQSLDKIHENIQQQMTMIEEQIGKLDGKLQQVDIDSYLSSNNEFVQQEVNYQEVQSIVVSQLERISDKESIQKCMNILSSLDFANINLAPEEQPEPEKIKEQLRTPNLNLACETHSKEIILFDLNEQKPKESRLACVTCTSDRIGPYTELQAVQKRWQDYESHSKLQLNAQQDSRKTKVATIHQSLTTLSSKFQEKITNALSQLSKKQMSQEKSTLSQISKMERDWQTLSKEEVLDIADILSRLQHKELLRSQIEYEFKKQDEEIDVIIKQALLLLKEAEQQCFEIIYKVINYEGSQYQIKQVFQRANQVANIDFVMQKPKLLVKHNVLSISTEIYKLKQKLQVNNKVVNYSVGKDKPRLQRNNNIFCNGFEKKKGELASNKIINVEPIKQKPMNYQQLVQNSIAQNDYCYAIAFNKESTIMVAGQHPKNIIVFGFSQGQLEQTQVLSDHPGNALTLYFMKQSNQFVSGGGEKDSSIRIWGVNNSQQWHCQQLLKEGHTSSVNQVIMNKSEDLIISCSNDKSIKFWVKKNEWRCSQTLSAHTNIVWGICLNESENQLVSFENSTAKILLSALNDDKKQWEVKQSITVDSYGSRVSFIGNNLIAFQPYNKVNMDIFKLDEQSKQFVKSTQVKVEKFNDCHYWFPQQFNKQKSILLSKNGDRVNLLRKKNNDKFVVEQSIKFGSYYLWGAMTEDGEYLVTWDLLSKQFQVRKQQ